jgi:predicted lipoprotein with Yx(FWY)xxD motif
MRPANRRLSHSAAMFAAGAVTVLVIVAAFSLLSNGSGSSTADEPAATRKPEPPPALRMRQTRLGPILTDAQGRTLYLFNEDKDGRSTCFSGCAEVWPPALVSGTPHVGPGLTARKLTTIRRGRTGRQLVYNGHPLYRMDADARPGDMQGEGFLGTWWVVSPAGKLVVAPGKKVAPAGSY